MTVPNVDVDPGRGFFTSPQVWWQTDAQFKIDSTNGLQCGVPSGSFAVCDERAGSQSPQNAAQCYSDADLKTAFKALQHGIVNYRANLFACLSSTQGAATPAAAGNRRMLLGAAASGAEAECQWSAIAALNA